MKNRTTYVDKDGGRESCNSIKREAMKNENS